MENKALSETLAMRLGNDDYFNRPDIYRYVNNTYCSCFKPSTSYHRKWCGDGIDYLNVNGTILCSDHMAIYMRKATENRIEKIEKTVDKMEKTVDKMEKMLGTILIGIKHITYRVDRNNFEPEINNLLGDITSGVRPDACDKKE